MSNVNLLEWTFLQKIYRLKQAKFNLYMPQADINKHKNPSPWRTWKVVPGKVQGMFYKLKPRTGEHTEENEDGSSTWISGRISTIAWKANMFTPLYIRSYESNNITWGPFAYINQI